MSILRDLVTDTSCESTSGTGGQTQNPLGALFQNFIDASKKKEFIEEIKLDKSINLTSSEKRKIKSRSEVMARQFFPGKPTTITLIIFL